MHNAQFFLFFNHYYLSRYSMYLCACIRLENTKYFTSSTCSRQYLVNLSTSPSQMADFYIEGKIHHCEGVKAIRGRGNEYWVKQKNNNNTRGRKRFASSLPPSTLPPPYKDSFWTCPICLQECQQTPSGRMHSMLHW